MSSKSTSHESLRYPSLCESLKKWYRAKKKIEKLEKKINNYKIAITKELNRRGTESLSLNEYCVTRRRVSRATVSRDSLPPELWKKYSSMSHFDTYYINKYEK